MKKLILILGVILVFNLSQAETFYVRNSQLINIPTAYIDGVLKLEARYQPAIEFTMSTSVFKRLGSGLRVYKEKDNYKDLFKDMEVVGDMRIKLVREESSSYFPSFAIGVKSISPDSGSNYNTVYAVATRSYQIGGQEAVFTFGAGNRDFQRVSSLGTFFGFKSKIHGSDYSKTTLMGEYDAEYWNLGVQYANVNGLYVKIFVTDLGRVGDKMGIGLDMGCKPFLLSADSHSGKGKSLLLTTLGTASAFALPALRAPGPFWDNFKECIKGPWESGDEFLSLSNHVRHAGAGAGIYVISSAFWAQIPLYKGKSQTESIERVEKLSILTSFLAGIGKEVWDYRKHGDPSGTDILFTTGGAVLAAKWNSDKWISSFLGKTGKGLKRLKSLFTKEEDDDVKEREVKPE